MKRGFWAHEFTGIMREMRQLSFLLPVLACAAMVTAQAAPPTKAAAAPVTNYKVSGSPSAPIKIEIYTDYECPMCRELDLNTLPPLIKDYVQTGKVQLLHRDFVLPQHKYSPIATKYANAAGEIGKYDLVATQIFQSQPQWSQNGNVDGEVAKVLSPADMQKVRDLVKASGPDLSPAVKADMDMGDKDGLRATPTIVIIAKGKREVISGGMPYNILKSYLDQKLK
jgi:protein-disulfide isomerase